MFVLTLSLRAVCSIAFGRQRAGSSGARVARFSVAVVSLLVGVGQLVVSAGSCARSGELQGFVRAWVEQRARALCFFTVHTRAPFERGNKYRIRRTYRVLIYGSLACL